MNVLHWLFWGYLCDWRWLYKHLLPWSFETFSPYPAFFIPTRPLRFNLDLLFSSSFIFWVLTTRNTHFSSCFASVTSSSPSHSPQLLVNPLNLSLSVSSSFFTFTLALQNRVESLMIDVWFWFFDFLQQSFRHLLYLFKITQGIVMEFSRVMRTLVTTSVTTFLVVTTS